MRKTIYLSLGIFILLLQFQGRDNDNRPDLCSTVYWNPNIETDDKENLTIKYFNTDLSGKYRVVIEGIGASGSSSKRALLRGKITKQKEQQTCYKKKTGIN